jgi:hypothetical protein
MKKVSALFALLFILIVSDVQSQTIFDNSSPGINYQMVVRDANGDPISNSAIVLTISFKGGVSNTVQYSETHAVNTDEFGLVNVVLGNGSPVSPYNAATFDNMNWTQYPVSMDVNLNSGGNFFLGNFALQSVPYSFFAEEADHAIDANFATTAGSVNMGLNALNDVTLTNSQNNQVLVYSGGQWINSAPFWSQANPGIMINSSAYTTRVAVTNLSNQSHNPTGLFSVNNEATAANSVQTVASFSAFTTGAPSNGLGAGIALCSEADNGGVTTNSQVSGIVEDMSLSTGAFQVSVRDQNGNLNPYLRLNSNGFLGIGTNAPTSNLQVHGNNFGISQLKISNNLTGLSGGANLLMNDLDFYVQNTHTGYFHLGTNWQTQITMAPSGNIGMGTSTPQANLHVHDETGVPVLQLTDNNTGTTINDGVKMSTPQMPTS